jgi:hypothetical protein
MLGCSTCNSTCNSTCCCSGCAGFTGQWERGRKHGVGIFEKHIVVTPGIMDGEVVVLEEVTGLEVFMEIWSEGSRMMRHPVTQEDKQVFYDGHETGSVGYRALVRRVRQASGVDFDLMESEEEDGEEDDEEEDEDEAMAHLDSAMEDDEEEEDEEEEEEDEEEEEEEEDEEDEEEDNGDEYQVPLSPNITTGAPPSGIDSGPSFQLGANVSQILSVEEEDDEASNSDDEDEVDEGENGDGDVPEEEDEDGGMSGLDEEDEEDEEDENDGDQHSLHNSSSIGDLSVGDISGRYRNPKRNLSEVKLTDLSRGSLGSCGSPVALKQRLQLLRDSNHHHPSNHHQNNNQSSDLDSSALSEGMSSMSVSSPVRRKRAGSGDEHEDISASSISFTFHGAASPRKDTKEGSAAAEAAAAASGGGKGSPLRIFRNHPKNIRRKKSSGMGLDLDGSL